MTINEFIEIKEISNLDDAIQALINFCNENDLYEEVEDFICTDRIDDIIKERLHSGSWEGVACLLDGVNNMNEEYYFMDGYANLRDAKRNDVECIIDDIIRFNYDIFEEEEEE